MPNAKLNKSERPYCQKSCQQSISAVFKKPLEWCNISDTRSEASPARKAV